MHKVQLFIENYELELNKDVQFAITRQFEDLQNPTSIINDWSKTVEIPETDRNNFIFGNIFNQDRVITEPSGGLVADMIGIYFNPFRKLDMRLMFNGMVIISGYAKMTEITKNNGILTYKLNINGMLGKIFQEMKKITLNPEEYTDANEKAKYYLDCKDYYEEYINKDLVYNSWTSNGQIKEGLEEKYYYIYNPTTGKTIKQANVNYHATDYVGFAPCNAFDDDFDYNTFQYASMESRDFGDVLDARFSGSTLGINGSDLVDGGVLPRAIGEYRSYLQMPYIYFNKLWKIFQKKAEGLTGYRFKMDSKWFNVNNPYWYKLVFMLKKLNVKKGISVENVYSNMSFDDESKTIIADWTTSQNYTTSRVKNYWHGNVDYEGKSLQANNKYYTGQYIYTLFKNNWTLKIREYESGKGTYLSKSNGLFIDVKMTGETGKVKIYKVLVVNTNTTISQTYKDMADEIIYTDGFSTEGSFNVININFNSIHSVNETEGYGDYVYFSTDCHWVFNSYPIAGASTKVEIDILVDKEHTQLLADIFSDYFRSNGQFTINDIWDNEQNIFEQILNYCKMYRLVVHVDETNKQIVFEPATEYFKRYTIEDWTDKVDMSKDFVVKPITWEDKYILFNYDDNDSTKLGGKYLKKYGVDYGERRIITEYNFNTETNELFDGLKTSLTNTDTTLSWSNLYAQKIRYSFPAEISVYSKDEDNKFIDNFGSYYFHRGLASWDDDESLNMRTPVKISDDTDFQNGYSKYFYSQALNSRDCSTYPFLDIVTDGNVCLFSTPVECYTFASDYNNTNGIYDNIWSRYIKERYSMLNKQITCYIRISPTDYLNFDFNKFVKIGNQLYMLNKIYDYDMSSLEPTKCDLITIQDVEGYTKNDYLD